MSYSRLDILPIVLQVQIPAFASDLRVLHTSHLSNGSSQPSADSLEADDVFQLYMTMNKLADLHRAFVPK